MTDKIIVIAIDVREGARGSLGIVYGVKQIYNLILCENQLGFTASLASLFQLLGIPLVVYAEFEPFWPRSLCCRIALGHDAHKPPYSPYMFSR